jgi:hypothetical protein
VTARERRCRAQIRMAAHAYAAALRRPDQLRSGWVEEVARARKLDVPQTVVGGFITEAAKEAGIPESEIPAIVWQAAGLDPPAPPSTDLTSP